MRASPTKIAFCLYQGACTCTIVHVFYTKDISHYCSNNGFSVNLYICTGTCVKKHTCHSCRPFWYICYEHVLLLIYEKEIKEQCRNSLCSKLLSLCCCKAWLYSTAHQPTGTFLQSQFPSKKGLSVFPLKKEEAFGCIITYIYAFVQAVCTVCILRIPVALMLFKMSY